MLTDVTEELFYNYLQGTSTAAETEAVQAWLAQPAHQLLAQHWMQQHWEALAARPTLMPAAEEPDYNMLLNGLHQQLGFAPLQRYQHPQPAPAWRRWAAAAALAGTVVGGSWLLYQQRTPAPLEYATAYGQTHLVHLPDGSEVTLNGHSRLRYAAQWKPDQPREVWLDGEGYFSVKHQVNNQHFVVHTQAGFNVEVLGTQFTVCRRRDQARVVLVSGKVRVDFDDQRPDLIMKPGELVETRDAVPGAVVRQVHTAPYAAWKDARLVLDETTIAELAARLQDTYGIEVVVATPELNQRKVTGSMAVRDLDVVLQALEESFQLKATRTGNRITLADADAVHPQ
jgi:ferric-dicitrate binding protein FerR (iron transport regulator)